MRFLLVFLLIPLSVCADSKQWQSEFFQDHPLVGKIYDVNKREFINEKQLLLLINNDKYILVGEKHDNPDHHIIEQKVLDSILSRKTVPVVFEMLNEQHIDGIKKLSRDETLSSVKKKLSWGPKDWKWDDYGSLFLSVVLSESELVAGNISKSISMKIYMGEAGLLEEESRFESMSAPTADQKARIMDDIYESHCEMMERTKLKPMQTIQLAKDASMASAMVTNNPDTGAVLIAGGFHTRKDISVPVHLKSLDPDGSQVVLRIIEIDPDMKQASEYEDMLQVSDYIWFTPVFTMKDYCEDMKK